MWVLHALKHLQLIVDHALVSLDILLEYDLDRDLLSMNVCLAHDTVRTGTECAPESVSGLLVVTIGLAMQPVDHAGDCGAA